MLHDRALGSLATLDRLATRPAQLIHPYGIYAKFLHGLSSAISSRFAEDRHSLRVRLSAARLHIMIAVKEMKHANYCLHLREACHVGRSVDAALRFHGLEATC
jgi:hypothetical protein